MSAFTPGPWMARPDRTVAASGTPLLRCYAGRNEEANAHLIAAAPELYEALLECRRLFDEALPKFDWGKSFLDDSAIRLLNDVPLAVSAALLKASPQKGEG